ncbi:DUF427 domain-containing protein [Nonomuraea rubra]|uniref:DUF427 domain-containing protein n=1 Tax=Nonomuraea rubra TaxID=46180 RepID=UPI0036179251
MDATNRGKVRVERTAKRVRTYLGGRVVADTTSALLVWEVPYYPTYYFPPADVEQSALKATGATKHSPSRGDAVVYTVTSGTAEAADAALAYPESPLEQIRGSCVSSGTRWTPGSRRTRRCSSTPATRTPGWTS